MFGERKMNLWLDILVYPLKTDNFRFMWGLFKSWLCEPKLFAIKHGGQDWSLHAFQRGSTSNELDWPSCFFLSSKALKFLSSILTARDIVGQNLRDNWMVATCKSWKALAGSSGCLHFWPKLSPRPLTHSPPLAPVLASVLASDDDSDAPVKAPKKVKKVEKERREKGSERKTGGSPANQLSLGCFLVGFFTCFKILKKSRGNNQRKGSGFCRYPGRLVGRDVAWFPYIGCWWMLYIDNMPYWVHLGIIHANAPAATPAWAGKAFPFPGGRRQRTSNVPHGKIPHPAGWWRRRLNDAVNF